jgi:putative SOS response-associated peptidase YedK
MCGRFTLRTPATVLIDHFDLDVRENRQLALFEPRYNIAPTQEIVVVRAEAGRRSAVPMRWGLLPSWSKGLASGPPMINARSETLAEKPAFRSAFRSRRCLIPADGFYEWRQQPTGGSKNKKQPFYIHFSNGRPFAFAGLWERWTSPAADTSEGTGLSIESCTIVTTAANSKLSELHDRMPVILAPNDYDLWLDSSVSDPTKLQHLLMPCGDDELAVQPVSTHVNKTANDDRRCIEAERTLF